MVRVNLNVHKKYVKKSVVYNSFAVIASQPDDALFIHEPKRVAVKLYST